MTNPVPIRGDKQARLLSLWTELSTLAAELEADGQLPYLSFADAWFRADLLAVPVRLCELRTERAQVK